VLAAVPAFRLYATHRFSTAKSRFEREVGSLELASCDRPDVPDQENAATHIRAGIDALVLAKDDSIVVDIVNERPASEWTPADRAKLESIVERNATAIGLFDRARSMTRSNWHIEYRHGGIANFSKFKAGIYAARMLRARARLALASNDLPTAIGVAEDLGAMARSYESEPSAPILMIGSTIERLQQSVLQDLTARNDLTAEEIARLEASVSGVDLSKAHSEAVRVFAVRWLQELRNDPHVENYSVPGMRLFRRGVEDLIAAAVIERQIGIPGTLGKAIAGPRSAETDATRGGILEAVLDMHESEMISISARMVATESSRDLARLALALRSAELATGAYPAALPSVQGVATSDPLTGTDRVYTTHDDGTAEIAAKTTQAILGTYFREALGVNRELYRWTLPAPSAPRPRPS